VKTGSKPVDASGGVPLPGGHLSKSAEVYPIPLARSSRLRKVMLTCGCSTLEM
jgi:hypothetical protein